MKKRLGVKSSFFWYLDNVCFTAGHFTYDFEPLKFQGKEIFDKARHLHQLLRGRELLTKSIVNILKRVKVLGEFQKCLYLYYEKKYFMEQPRSHINEFPSYTPGST